MTIEIQAFVPGQSNPVDLDVYADIVAGVVGNDPTAPDVFGYSNPKTETEIAAHNEQED